MSFSSRITRAPVPYDAAQGAEAAARYPDAPPELAAVIAGAAGCSPYLAGLIEREVGWLAPVLAGSPEEGFAALIAQIADLAPAVVGSGLRLAKRRAAVLIALADLAGVWSLEEVTGALTRLADAAVRRALTALVGAEIARGRIPGAVSDDIATAAGMVVLAMGKMGAHELNYSSDIDLICLFDENRFAPDDAQQARAAFIRITRRLAALLSDMTAEGYVFRTDLRLRPDPSVTPVCLSMGAAESYYESVGRNWERAIYIKARACAGDLAAGMRFLERLRPFVWRKYLDFAAIRDAHDMRLRIRAHKGLRGGGHGGAREPITLAGHDLKLGAGGIREIEFFTQTRQLISGGRDPDLRVRGTVEGLARLAKKGWVSDEAAVALTTAYRAHRELEHRLQMIGDAQTQKLPTTPAGFERLACFSGTPDTGAFRAALAQRLERVDALTERFFSPAVRSVASAPALSAQAHAIVERWQSYPALRSARAVEIFRRLRPDILAHLGRSARPEEALIQFDRFLNGLPAGVQLFSLFEANPQLIELIVDVVATAPALAHHLARNPGVFDAVISGGFFAPWPGDEPLSASLQRGLGQAVDYEGRLDAARRWVKEGKFRIGVHHLRGLIDAVAAGGQYADLAETALAGLWPHVLAEMTAKHGKPPGRGAAVLAMGSLGARQMHVASDLDLIVIYDALGEEASRGHRPLDTRRYYARLTQALMAALSAPTAEGRLYEVDMRLRPSGRQGPVATGFAAFRDYQSNAAWTWEHLALTRARAIAGEPELMAEIEAFRRQILARKGGAGTAAETLRAVAEMRGRIAASGRGGAPWEAKLGAGRLQDIELFAAAGALIAGAPARSVPEQLAAGAGIGCFSTAEAERLGEVHALHWRLRQASKLLGARELDMETIGKGGRAFILRETEAASVAVLASRMEAERSAAEQIIEAVLARYAFVPRHGEEHVR